MEISKDQVYIICIISKLETDTTSFEAPHLQASSPQDRDAIRWAAEQILNDRDFAAAVAQWHGEAMGGLDDLESSVLRNLMNQNGFHVNYFAHA